MHMFPERVRLFLIIYFGYFEILTISHWLLFRPCRKINADYFALRTLLAKLINRLINILMTSDHVRTLLEN